MTTFKKTFSFTIEFKDVYDHLQKQDNASKYIARLVRADMNKQSLEKQIEEIVEKILSRNEPKQSAAIAEALKEFF